MLCDAVLEHYRFFWKILAEIRRVTRVGGLIVIGAPGYRNLPYEKKLHRLLSRLASFSRHPEGWPLQHSTLTLATHNFPGDYYRFSEQEFREVFFEEMTDVVSDRFWFPRESSAPAVFLPLSANIDRKYS